MSRYDLESALTDFIQNAVSTEEFASYDHEHDHECTNFEDGVDNYLRNFTIGAHCSVQRMFENSVRIVVEHYMSEEWNASEEVRVQMRIALRRVRSLDAEKVLPAIMRFSSELLDLVVDAEKSVKLPDEVALVHDPILQPITSTISPLITVNPDLPANGQAAY